jgi:hypothetical protein
MDPCRDLVVPKWLGISGLGSGAFRTLIKDKTGGNLIGKQHALGFADKGKHHIKGGRRTCAGQPIAADLIAGVLCVNIGKLGCEGVNIFPVNGGAVAVQKASLGHDPRATIDTCDEFGGMGDAAQAGM